MPQETHADPHDRPATPLRRGWTTGSCATAAVHAACAGLLTGRFPDPVTITLPNGHPVAFALANHALEPGAASAAIVKDAGDDPDVTHGALVRARVRLLPPGQGLRFLAGEGIGTVTRPGLPLPPGEPAINPVPRRMIAATLAGLGVADAEITLSIPGGERLAERTLNGRLGIVGGLSILGTTGIVVPFSCAAWIDTIRRGIDVARATGLTHIAGSTGDASERAVQALHGLPETALIEMGDFAGGLLKYVRDHPVPRLSLAGGVAKMTKLGQGLLDLHSARGRVELAPLAELATTLGAVPALAARIAAANTTAQAFALAGEGGLALGDAVAERAWSTAAAVLSGSGIALELLLFDRDGALQGRTPFRVVDDAAHDRNRLR